MFHSVEGDSRWTHVRIAKDGTLRKEAAVHLVVGNPIPHCTLTALSFNFPLIGNADKKFNTQLRCKAGFLQRK